MKSKKVNRSRVRPKEMSNSLNNGNSKMRIQKKRGQFKAKKLYSNLAVPSYVHGYSLAIEFMRDWFLEKFPKDYFKTVYINGKHVLDDYKIFNRDVIKREKPMVAITPTVEYDYDREYVDMYLSDPSIFLKRSNYQQAFFKDDERDLYLGLDFQAIRMNFQFRIRVSSRAQQLDLFKEIELMFRIGATQQKNVSADFHVPKYIMLDIAERAAFEVDREQERIINVMDFLSYMNSHSELPVMFKLRAINQKPEFFIRVKDMYVHVACKDKLSLDDGERDGQLDNNFHVEMQATLTMPVPHYYVYYQSEPLSSSITLHQEPDMTHVGLYSFNDWSIPEKNQLGWYVLGYTGYLCDKGEKYIDMHEIFEGHTNLNIAITHSLKNFISPMHFIDVQVFTNDDRAMRVKSKMNYENFNLELLDTIDDEETVIIVIYADREYVNDTVITVEQYKNNRLKSD